MSGIVIEVAGILIVESPCKRVVLRFICEDQVITKCDWEKADAKLCTLLNCALRQVDSILADYRGVSSNNKRDEYADLANRTF